MAQVHTTVNSILEVFVFVVIVPSLRDIVVDVHESSDGFVSMDEIRAVFINITQP
jgi:hypothetical protein